MTMHQTAVNSAALRNLAARLERLGYVGDCHAEAEHIVVNLLADGYRRIEPVPPVRCPNPAGQDSPGRRAFAAARAALATRHNPTEGENR